MTAVSGSVLLSATLTVTPSLAMIAINVSGSGYADGEGDSDDKATLSWSLSGGATECEVSGAWPPHTVPQFSLFPVTASGSRQILFTAVGTYT
jgi:hypothetical protein